MPLAFPPSTVDVPPAVCVPVVIDVGTDNEDLLRSPFYVGVRHRRVRGDAYYELLDEFLTAVKRRWAAPEPRLLHLQRVARVMHAA